MQVQLLLLAYQLRHVPRDQILVLHGENGQLDADHPPDFARPQASRVDHMLRMHIALIGDHIPRPVGSRGQVGHARMPHDPCAADLRRLCVSMRNAVRVHMTFDGIVHGAMKMSLVQQREQLRSFIHRNDFQVHAEITSPRLRHFQPIQPLACAGQHDPAGDVYATGVAGYCLDLLVQPDGVLLQLGHIGDHH